MFEIKKFKGNSSEIRAVFFTDRKKISDFKNIIARLPRGSAIIVREYDLNKIEREKFAQQIIDLVKSQNRHKALKVLVGKDLQLARKIKADGIHYSDLERIPIKILKAKSTKSFPQKFIFSLACHSEQSVIKSYKQSFDMIFISPIFTTTSHEDVKPIGLRNFSKIALKAKKQEYFRSEIYATRIYAPRVYVSRIYALGGVNLQNLRAIRKLKIAGFGAIDIFSIIQ